MGSKSATPAGHPSDLEHPVTAMASARRLLSSPEGMTLLEVVLALTILGVVALLLTGTLRVGIRAWEAGERQAGAQQETRAVVELVTEALSGAYPYRSSSGPGAERVVLFEGEASEVRFVTTAAPLGLDAPDAPFHAVTLGKGAGDRLRVVERLVPNEEPFREGTTTTLSRTVTDFRLQYRDATGSWVDQWDGKSAAGLPTAVRVDLAIQAAGRKQEIPPLLVPIPLGKDTTTPGTIPGVKG
jgi:general secretion pathway protein J